MARSSKSQWEFNGDLFAPAELAKKPESVTELTQQLKRQIEGAFTDRRVAGEVSNYRLQASGHAYFVLKDAGAQLSCVLFRGQGGSARHALKDGAQVVLTGDLTVYEPRGNYQMRVSAVELQGVGALQAAFEKLKARLAAEGLFDAARKRPIPMFPVQIGLVTSPTGAAIRDVLHVLERRFCPGILLEPVRVQGQGAAQEIAGAIERLNLYAAQGGRVDLILVTRGGGSIEDLWCFNEEVVARAIAASTVPVISAVGHEIDFTIADFAADLRAATPSAAAEILSQHYVESQGFVAEAGERLVDAAHGALSSHAESMEGLRRRLQRLHPRRRLEERGQRLDDAVEGLQRAVERVARDRRRDLADRLQRLVAARPAAHVKAWKLALSKALTRLESLPADQLARRRRRLTELETRLRLLSPQSVLDRGYSLTFDAETGRVVRDAAEVKSGSRLRTRLQHGEVTSVATRSVAPEANP
jgi:exodeoxyribonuclease VII large subunit